MNLLQLLYYCLGYLIRIYRQQRFIKSFLLPILDETCKQHNFIPNKKEELKIKFYYPLFNHVGNCENYLTIKGRTLTRIESERLAFINVWATLYDDFIDEDTYSKEKLIEILEKRLPENERTPKIKVFMAMDDKLKAIFKPTEFYDECLKNAIDWQLLSLKQFDSTITLKEILEISNEKCGHSSLLWASILDEQWGEDDKLFIYQSGFIVQLINDAYDIYKDINDGVYTYIRKCASITQARSIFMDACRVLNQDILHCDAPLLKKLRTINRLACLNAFGLVAFDHLEKIDTKYPNPVDWQQVKRSDLVTDFDLWGNWFKLFKYSITLSKLN